MGDCEYEVRLSPYILHFNNTELTAAFYEDCNDNPEPLEFNSDSFMDEEGATHRITTKRKRASAQREAQVIIFVDGRDVQTLNITEINNCPMYSYADN